MSLVEKQTLVLKGSSSIKSTVPDISTNLLHIGVYWVGLLILGRVIAHPGVQKFLSSFLGQGVAVLAATSLFFLAFTFRRVLYQTLTTFYFAVALMISIVAATCLGTFIIQTGAVEELGKIYGPTISKIIVGFGFNDLFHTIWFGGFLVLLALSLLLAALKKKMWRVPKWGYLLSHLGVVVVIAGGFTGFFFGVKGMMDMRKGQTMDTVRSLKPGPSEFTLPGFALALKDFEVEHYHPEYRLYLYQMEGDSFEVTKSLTLEDAASWIKGEDRGYEFRVTKTYPDFAHRTELKEASDGTGSPALALDISNGDKRTTVNLLANDPQRDNINLDQAAAALRFVWNSPSEAEIEAFAEIRPEAHAITFQESPDAPGQTMEVKPGGSYSLDSGKYKLEVLAFIPDFVYDTDKHQPESRSANPNNPALQVALIDTATDNREQRWLFANMPDFDMKHGRNTGGPRLVYQYTPATSPRPREFMIVGGRRELLEFDNGQISKSIALGPEEQGIPELMSPGYKLYASAGELDLYESRSQEWKNPVVQIELKSHGQAQTLLLPALHSEPTPLPDKKSFLAFQTKPDDVKAYHSTLAVVQEGGTVAEKTIAVNDPLSFGGYKFYQSNYRKEDPEYSGLLVVRDPGLPVVWTGFIMICFGVVYSFYVRPRVIQGRKNHVD